MDDDPTFSDLGSGAAQSVNNPQTPNPGGLQSFFSFLGGAASNFANAEVTNLMSAQQAKNQALLNSYHAVNPSLGPNNTAAAQDAANRTFLEKYLPANILYTQDPVTKVTKLSPMYWLILGGLVLALVWVVRRILK